MAERETIAQIPQCVLCPRNFKTVPALRQHLVQVHYSDDLLKESNSLPHKCGICRAQFCNLETEDGAYEGHITWHLAFTHGMLRQQVPQCAKNYEISHKLKPKVSLSRVRVSKSEEVMVKQEEQTNSRFECALCPRYFDTQNRLECHLTQIHFSKELIGKTNSSLNKCGLCGEKFRRPGRNKWRMEGLVTWHLSFTHSLLKQNVSEDTKLSSKLLPSVDLPKVESNGQRRSRKHKKSINFKTDKSGLRSNQGCRRECLLCPLKFKTWQGIRLHLAQFHFMDKMMAMTGSTVHKCGTCNEEYNRPGLSKSAREALMTWHLAFTHKLLQKLIPKEFAALKMGKKLKATKELLKFAKENDYLKKKKKKANKSILSEATNSAPRQPCFLCPRDFKSWRTLKCHLAENHFMKELLEESGSSEGKCGICGKQYNKSVSTGNVLTWHLAFTHKLLGRLIPRHSMKAEGPEQPEQPYEGVMPLKVEMTEGDALKDVIKEENSLGA